MFRDDDLNRECKSISSNIKMRMMSNGAAGVAAGTLVAGPVGGLVGGLAGAVHGALSSKDELYRSGRFDATKDAMGLAKRIVK